jgi:pilus assembly protein CpaE
MAQAAKIVVNIPPAVSLLALVADEVTREAASRAAAQLGWTDVTVQPGGLAKAARTLDPSKPPSVLLVDLAEETDPDAAIGDLVKRSPQTRVLAIGSVNDVTLFRRLAARGVSDYLVKPVSSELLCDALRRAVSGEAEATAPQRRGRVHAFIGARGGVGTSTLALGVAWVLTQEQKLQTAMVDLDLHFGNLALSLDLEPGRGLRQALEHPERTDSLLLASAMVKSDERLPILAAEESLEDMLRFEPAGASALITALAQDYDCLLVDVPRSLDGAARHVLATADSTVIVTDLSLAALRDAFRLSGLVKALGAAEAPVIVASQVGALHRGEIGRTEFERGLGATIDFCVPFDPKAARAMAVSGKSLPAAEASGRAAAEIRRIAARLSGREAMAKKGLKRWFG